jgi:GGDEF domain-containing protein
MVFLSITGFGEYVSNYGYTQGNDVLIRVSNIIRDVISDNDQAEDYIASLGSERFSVMSSVSSAVGLAEILVDRLNQLLPEAYNESDRKQGYIEVKDRRGNTQQHNLMTAIAAIVSNEIRKFEHPEEVFRVGDELIRHIETLKDKNVMKDRRRN